MPTAAKLIGALVFAALAAVAAQVYIPLLPEGTQTRWMREICGGIGLIIGWLVMGRNAGRGYADAAAMGIRASVTVVFLALLGFSIYVMVVRSTRMMYDGPMEAVLDVFNLMLNYGKLMLEARFIGVLAVGGVLGGMITEYFGRRWS